MTSSISASYYFVEEIASGGMGRVSLVLRREKAFRRLYAIKRLHSHLREDPDVRAMFVEEARLAGLISHPNVVGVIDVGEDRDGPYLVMDHVDGVSADKVLRTAAVTGMKLPVTVALEIVEQAARGLHAAHELRDHSGQFLELVHRDVSPQNVLLGYDGIVRVADFGIAKALDRASRTSTGILKGKLGYSSPEQLRFELLDRRSDLFALGIVLYELLTSDRLYSNADARGPSRILNEPPPDVGAVRAGLPPPLVELAYELLAKDRADRPSTALEVAERVRAIRDDLAVMDEDAETLERFMSTRFAEGVKRQRELIATASERLDRGELDVWPVTPVAAPASRARMLPYAVALVTLIAGLGIGAWTFGGTDATPIGTASDDTSVRSSAAPPPGEPVPTGESPATPVASPSMAGAPAPAAGERRLEDLRSARARRRNRAARAAPPSAMEPAAAPEAQREGSTMELAPWTFDGMR